MDTATALRAAFAAACGDRQPAGQFDRDGKGRRIRRYLRETAARTGNRHGENLQVGRNPADPGAWRTVSDDGVRIAGLPPLFFAPKKDPHPFAGPAATDRMRDCPLKFLRPRPKHSARASASFPAIHGGSEDRAAAPASHTSRSKESS